MSIWQNIVNILRESLFTGTGAYDPDANLQADQGGSLYYRRLTQSERDLSPIVQERALTLAYWLWDTNPMAKRIIELVKDFVVGEGITVQASSEDDSEREDIQAVIDDFWDDPLNQMDIKLHQKVQELGLYGEQCYPVFVNPINGKVRLGYIDPGHIKDVIHHPENAEQAIAVVVKSKDSLGVTDSWYKVLQVNEDATSGSYGRITASIDGDGKPTDTFEVGGDTHTFAGYCFWFAINKVSNARRGRSDLLTLADWIDGYDQLLFNEIDRSLLLKAFLWDVTVEGATPAEILDIAKKSAPPKPDTVRYHNEKYTWQAVTPDLKTVDATNTADLILSLISTGSGLAKAQPLECKVLTPTGWRLMGDLQVGDVVITPDGSYSTVITGVYPQGSVEVFDITFSDGAKTQATGDHLWLTRTAKDRSRGRTGTVKTTQEISQSLKKGASWNHYIPLLRPTDAKDICLPVDPYVLGVLLGDGHIRQHPVSTGGIEILLSSADTEIIVEVNKLLGDAGEFTYTGQQYDYRYNYPHKRAPLRQALKVLGLCGVHSATKFIPPLYFTASASQRLSLLQGLLDTDGSPSARTSARVVTTSPQLAEDMRNLAWGLGGVCTLTNEQTSFRHKGEQRNGAPSFALRITLPEGMDYFRLERKTAKILPGQKLGRAVRTFRSIEPSGQQLCQCISVAHPCQLYITDDYIVTHNTWLNGTMDVNKATASGLEEPTFKRLTSRQKYVIYALTQIITFVLDQAEIYGRLPKREAAMGLMPEAWPFEITAPEMRMKDTGLAATAFNQAVQALIAALTEDVIDIEIAQQIAASLVTQFGVDIDLEAMRERLAKAKEEKDAQAAVAPYSMDMVAQDEESEETEIAV